MIFLRQVLLLCGASFFLWFPNWLLSFTGVKRVKLKRRNRLSQEKLLHSIFSIVMRLAHHLFRGTQPTRKATTVGVSGQTVTLKITYICKSSSTTDWPKMSPTLLSAGDNGIKTQGCFLSALDSVITLCLFIVFCVSLHLKTTKRRQKQGLVSLTL